MNVNIALTRGKMPFGKISGMSDDGSWRKLQMWDRVKWARRRWQRLNDLDDTAVVAATALGMKQDTYSAYERRDTASKWTPLSYERAVEFAELFGVRWEWLFKDDGEPFLNAVDARGKILQALDSVHPDELAVKADAIVTLLRPRAPPPEEVRVRDEDDASAADEAHRNRAREQDEAIDKEVFARVPTAKPKKPALARDRRDERDDR